MYSLWVRFNSVTYWGVVNLLMLCVFAEISYFLFLIYRTWFHHGKAELKQLNINNVYALRSGPYGDRAVFNFDLDADLRPLWNWNVKQLFCCVIADFETSKVHSSITIWDTIIQKKDDALLHKQKQEMKYNLQDKFRELRGANVRLTLLYDVMPHAGLINHYEIVGGNTTLPNEYK